MSTATETKPKRVRLTPEQRRERKNRLAREWRADRRRRLHEPTIAKPLERLDKQAPNPLTLGELAGMEWHDAIIAAKSEARRPNARVLITSKRIDKEIVSFVTRYDAAALAL